MFGLSTSKGRGLQLQIPKGTEIRKKDQVNLQARSRMPGMRTRGSGAVLMGSWGLLATSRHGTLNPGLPLADPV